MTDFAKDSWKRALASLEAAERLVPIDPDSSASRAYYAAFHGVSALFALRDKTFSKHSQLRSAVHRELVRGGEWAEDLGRAYDFLLNLRETGDYGGKYHVSVDDAREAIRKASLILSTIRETSCRDVENDS